MCMRVLTTYVFVHHMHVCCPWSPGEVRAPETGLTVVSHHMAAMEEEPVLLSVESSLQPYRPMFLKEYNRIQYSTM